MHVREKAEKRVDAKIRFQENLFKFIVSNTILVIVCFVFLGDFWLLKFAMLFGGTGKVSDASQQSITTNTTNEVKK